MEGKVCNDFTYFPAPVGARYAYFVALRADAAGAGTAAAAAEAPAAPAPAEVAPPGAPAEQPPAKSAHRARGWGKGRVARGLSVDPFAEAASRGGQ